MWKRIFLEAIRIAIVSKLNISFNEFVKMLIMVRSKCLKVKYKLKQDCKDANNG